MSYRACRRAAFYAIVVALALAGAGRSHDAGHTLAAMSAGAIDPAAYHVAVETSETGGGSTWTYTITKAAPGAKDLGHFIVDFDNCGEQSPSRARILSATVNGVDWLAQIETTDTAPGCGVASSNFVKFDNLPPTDAALERGLLYL